MSERVQGGRMERQRTTKDDVGVRLEAHGETSRHCNIFLCEDQTWLEQSDMH